VHVGPLAHADVVEELAAAQASEGAGAEVALLLLQVVPEVEEGEEVARRIGEARVRSACSRAAGSSADGRSRTSWIDSPATIASTSGSTSRRRASMSMRAKRGSIGRRAISRPREVPRRRDGAQFGEQVERRLHAAAVGLREEREVLDVAEAEGEHLQDDRRERGAEDLGLGVLGRERKSSSL
jgi:hypothetical protein